MQSGVAEKKSAQIPTDGYLRTVSLRSIALSDCRDIVQTWAGNELCEWSPQNGIIPDSNVRDVAEYVDAKNLGFLCDRLWNANAHSGPRPHVGRHHAGCKSLPSRSLNVIAQACLGLNNAVVLQRDGTTRVRYPGQAAA